MSAASKKAYQQQINKNISKSAAPHQHDFIAEKRKLLDKLHTLGLERYGLKLPEIAVMGDTSSGKSSLLSAISGIEFPKKSEICTLCPLRLRMYHDASIDFSAEVDIFCENGGLSKEKWQKKRTSNDRDEVSNWIEEAQACILDAKRKAQGATDDGKKHPGISTDVVEISVRGKGYEDLTLVDLPGIVRSVADGEDKSLIKDIDNLLQKFLNNERCIILVVIPANTDAHNNKVITDCDEVDPEQMRTIPVITKPDLVDLGAENGVLRILNGQYRPFKHGVHMVKCRGQRDLDNKTSLKDAEKNESDFFSSKEPWQTYSDRSAFGIPNLRHKLAKLQSERITMYLPTVLAEIQKKYEEATTALEKLGAEIPGHKRLSTFCAKLERFEQCYEQVRQGTVMLTASVEESTWCAQLKDRYEEFAKALLTLRPGCTVEANLDWNKATTVEFQDKLGDERHGRALWTVGEMAVCGVRTGEAVVVPLKEEDDGCECSRPDLDEDGEILVSRESEDDYFPVWTGGTVVLLAEKDTPLDFYWVPLPDLTVAEPQAKLLQQVKNCRSADLPVFVSPSLFKAIMGNFLDLEVQPIIDQLLKSVSEKFLPRICDQVSDRVFADVDSQFPGLRPLIQNLLETTIQSAVEDIQASLEQITKNEHVPSTQNDYLYESLMKKRSAKLKKEILDLVGRVADPEALKQLIKAVFEANQKIPPNEYNATELLYILQAYWRVVVKRLMDHVPQTLDAILLENLGGKLRQYVTSVLPVDGKSHSFHDDDEEEKGRDGEEEEGEFLAASINAALSEPADTNAKRRLLEEEIRVVRAALKETRKLSMMYPTALPPAKSSSTSAAATGSTHTE